MSGRRKIRTLYSKKGKVWTDDEFSGFFHDLAFRRPPTSAEGRQDEFDFLSRNDIAFLRRMLLVGGEPESEPYATSEDLHNVAREIKVLEEKLNTAIASMGLGDITAAVGCLISEIENLQAIREVSYRYEGKRLDFFLVADEFSSDLLDKISETEIALSRNFPNLSIYIEPILCDEKVPEESHVMFVRK